MKLKKFCEPKIEVVVFDNNDVIVTSPPSDAPNPEVGVQDGQ